MSEDVVASLKANSKILDLVSGLVSSKRDATKEAKQRRLELEGLKQSQEAAATKQAQEQGKFKELYESTASELTKMRESIKANTLKSKLEIEGVKEGIKSPEYLKLLDVSGLEIDESGEISGLKEKFTAFKKTHPDLFASKGAPTEPTSNRPMLKNTLSDVEKLKSIAEKDRSTSNVAAFYAAHLAKNGG